MRKLVTIQRIKDIQPIPLADTIEKAQINEWWVVVKKGEFKVNELVCYFEIDSFLPVIPEYDFLLRGSKPKKMLVDGIEKEGIRLKTIKLRGQISQGLIMPISILEGKKYPNDSRENSEYKFTEGKDVSELLNVIKYEPPVPANLAGLVKGNFPSFIPKTDEERLQNCSYLLDEEKGTLVYITSKLDGTSVTYFKYNGEFGVCSRNLELKETEGNTLWEMAKQYKLRDIPDGFAVQGELMGEGINKNQLKLKGHRLFVFNVYDINNSKYLDINDMFDFCNKYGLEFVPILFKGIPLNFTFDELMEIANKKSPFGDFMQEGIVVRPIIEKRVMIGGTSGRFSFKLISNNYLLKEE